MVKLCDILQLLLRLKTDDCWCEKGIGNPMVQEHTAVCLEAQETVDLIKQQLQAERILPVRMK